MPTLVEQLQRDAINVQVPVSSLLRKAKLVAAKLGLPNVEEWVASELEGYRAPLPEYRQVPGHPYALNPARGWIPLHGDARFVDLLSSAEVGESVSSLEALMNSDGDGSFYMPFPAEIVERINQLINFRSPRIAVRIGRSQLAAILDQVRTMTLDWSLKLEREGITGSDIGFDAAEKQIAHSRQVHIHIGSIGNFSGSLSSDIRGNNARLNVGARDRSQNRS